MNEKTYAKLRPWGIAAVILLALGCGGYQFLLLLVGYSGYAEISWALVFGWIGFLMRTLPRVTWNGSMVGMGILCTVGSVFLTQWLLREFTRHLSFAPWRWRWTVCGIGALAVLFLVGLAIGGSAHQIGWMMGSDVRWFKERIHDQSSGLDGVASNLLREGETDPAVWRTKLMESPRVGVTNQWAIDRAQILFVLDDQGAVTGAFIIPRDKESGWAHGVFHTKGKQAKWLYSAQQVRDLIREHSAHLEAF